MKPAPCALPVDRVLGVPLRTEVFGPRGMPTHLAVWSGDEGIVVLPKRKPGFWSPTPDGAVAEIAEKRRLSDTTRPPSTWYRLEFDTITQAQERAKQMRREGLGSYVGDDDRWTTRLLVEEPDYFRQFPMSRGLRILTLDIEQFTEGGAFPKRDAPMVSCAFGHADGTLPHVVVAAAKPDGSPDDGPIVQRFREELEAFNPDIVAVFNAGYDTMVMSARAVAHGYPFTDWGRLLPTGERMMSYEYTPAGGRKNDRSIYIGGRVVWDLRRNANTVQDYNLAGVKDEKLKTIGEFLGLPVIKENVSETATLWRENPTRLAEYNANDVVLLEHLVARYLADRVALAEFYGAPLDMVLDAPAGWGGTVASARVLFSQGIVSDGRNIDRHRQFLRFKTFDGVDDEEVVQFEGAHIALYKRGLTAPLYKCDFASLYPNVIIATRMGPDNTRLVATRPLTEEPKFRTSREGDVVLIYVPDEKYGHAWVVEVRGESAFTPLLKARMEDRLAAKKAGDNTRANILKTLLNAMFGVHGALGNKYGVLPIAIVTAGLARELIRAIEARMGDAKVETDTDGVYASRKFNGALLSRAANKRAEELGFEPVFSVDTEEYRAGWFHEAKTYLLLTKSGKVKRFGVAMKGKRHPAAFDRIMEDVGRLVLEGNREAALARAKEFLNIEAYDPRDFVQRLRLGQPIGAYKAETAEVKLARKYEQMFGVEPTVGQSYEYVVVKGKERVPPSESALRDLDAHHYLDGVILTALERLGFTREELGVESQVTTLAAQAKRPRGELSLFDFAQVNA